MTFTQVTATRGHYESLPPPYMVLQDTGITLRPKKINIVSKAVPTCATYSQAKNSSPILVEKYCMSCVQVKIGLRTGLSTAVPSVLPHSWQSLTRDNVFKAFRHFNQPRHNPLRIQYRKYIYR